MQYDYALIIDAGRAEDNPVELKMHLTHGVITRVEVEFPAGCVYQLSAVILHRRFQLYPVNRDGKFCSDDHTIAFDDYFEMFDTPYELTAIGWAPDTTYPHTVWIRITILPRSIAEHRFGIPSKLERAQMQKLLQMFGVVAGEGEGGG